MVSSSLFSFGRQQGAFVINRYYSYYIFYMYNTYCMYSIYHMYYIFKYLLQKGAFRKIFSYFRVLSGGGLLSLLDPLPHVKKGLPSGVPLCFTALLSTHAYTCKMYSGSARSASYNQYRSVCLQNLCCALISLLSFQYSS